MDGEGRPRGGPIPGPIHSIARAGDFAADAVGHFAAIALLCLTLGLVLGIVLRWVGIDNSWTYDFDLFSLAWVAFAGAVLTARHDRHVTSGIALERMVAGRGRTVFRWLRVVVVIGFLVLFTLSGWWDLATSYQTHEKTIDVVQWPVWVAKAALPVGTVFWAIAEISKSILRPNSGGHE